jgi:hypothetical protein
MKPPNLLRYLLLISLSLSFSEIGLSQQVKGVRIVSDETAKRVDVFIDGQPFTTYTWTERLKTPVLNPLRTARGTVVTRGFPLTPRPGERVDHPHHVGMWFNYGDVNGIDFWNNSTSLPPERQKKMGTVVHRRILESKEGREKGKLQVETDWIMPDGKTILRETSSFIFHAGSNLHIVDRVTRLTALDQRVVLKDNKEGMLGMRVRRELEQPTSEPLLFTDASGAPTTVKVLDNTGVNGLYHSSEGKSGDAVWGTRGRWTMLTGKVDQEEVTLAILDHPENPGFPTYWHARGYGLFAANPLGQEVFSNGREKLNLTIEPKQSVVFRYRVLILSERASPDQIEASWRQFVRD